MGWHCADIVEPALPEYADCLVDGLPNSGQDACDVGFYCRTFNPNVNDGYCAALCSGTSDAPICTDALVCDQTDELTPFCSVRTCDPLAQDCSDGQTCLNLGLLFMDFVCVETSADAAGFRESCVPTPEFGEESNCAEGLTCVTFPYAPGLCSGLACCTAFCDVGGSLDCPTGTSCTPVSGDVGICIVAP